VTSVSRAKKRLNRSIWCLGLILVVVKMGVKVPKGGAILGVNVRPIEKHGESLFIAHARIRRRISTNGT